MRSDGSIFPAELAIGRVDLPGPPLFTACIRDISKRRDAEARLRAPSSVTGCWSSACRSPSTSTASDEVSSNVYTSPQIESHARLLGRRVGREPRPLRASCCTRRIASASSPRISARMPRARTAAHRVPPAHARRPRRVGAGRGARHRGRRASPVLQGYLLDVTAREGSRGAAAPSGVPRRAHRAREQRRCSRTGSSTRSSSAQQADSRGVAVLFLDLDDFKGRERQSRSCRG